MVCLQTQSLQVVVRVEKSRDEVDISARRLG